VKGYVRMERPSPSTPQPHADARVALLRRYAWLMDECIRIPGTKLRIGIDPLLGLIPGAGDAAGGLLALTPLFVASRLGAPRSVLLRMSVNIGVDALVGAIPLLGDLFDAGWKANRRNVDLIDRFLAEPRPVARGSRLLVFALAAVLILLIFGAILGVALAIRWLVAALG
jgi:hypothetical protein